MIFGLCLLLFPARICASPAPSEITKAKEKAPVHLIGVVISDRLYQDQTKETDHPSQIRRMALSVKQLIKAPQEQSFSEVIVYYVYRPSWIQDELGSVPLSVAVGDVVEVWLKQGKRGWEPALGRWTVRHLSYAEKRSEPIPEPFLHMAERYIKTSWRYHSGGMVWGGVIFFLFVFVLFVKLFNLDRASTEDR
ncbi:hypothetical protein GFC29_1150 [Anoxybacillus sp. B7M1]|uniref:hypothetical protein n=1 Tax=unclassified Anoxybacillus TaxID=2639704 RepID=UPI0005CD0177|nr:MULTISPECIES: hypothetical protein [unclassified Anoxybacillus]ANB57104.1 hypothetical protein GFC28_474 [Anoxybacillus sp. B2M1]ANB65872.1 hypothetical protein GFC29_1150 [Anoxybacillus sp. B7M1]